MSYYKFTVVLGHRDGNVVAHSLRGHWKPGSMANYCSRHNLDNPRAEHHAYDMSGHGRSDSVRVDIPTNI